MGPVAGAPCSQSVNPPLVPDHVLDERDLEQPAAPVHTSVRRSDHQPPTLLWENSATNDTASPSAASEFATWLATVRFN